MSRTEKGVLKRGKLGIYLWDYSTVVEWEQIKYLLTLDHVELYKDTIKLTDIETNHILQAHIHAMGNGSIYDN